MIGTWFEPDQPSGARSDLRGVGDVARQQRTLRPQAGEDVAPESGRSRRAIRDCSRRCGKLAHRREA